MTLKSLLSVLMCFDGCRPTSIWKRWDGFHQRHGSHLHTHIPVFWSETILALSFFLIILPSLCLYSAGSKHLHWRTCSSEDHQTWARWVWSHSVVLKEVWCEACGEAHMTHPVLFLPVQHEREINDCSDWCTWTLVDGHMISVSQTICIF